MKNIFITVFFLTLMFGQNQIEGRWHLVGYEDNVMYQFVDDELYANAGLRYTLYSIDGNFGDLDEAGGSPNPYSIVDDIITINMFFGTIVSYKINFTCDGQVVEFRSIENENLLHSTLFREGYEYHNNQNCQCENGSLNNNNPCNPMECINGQWLQIVIDCAEPMGIPCEGGLYIPPLEGVCCSECVLFGDTNNDSEVNVLDIVLIVGFILMTDEPMVAEFYSADINLDQQLNVLDVVAIVQMILNPINEDCYIEPEVGPCEGLCPTYYFNQITNQCEEFITGCCGIEVFSTMGECQSVCE